MGGRRKRRTEIEHACVSSLSFPQVPKWGGDDERVVRGPAPVFFGVKRIER